MARARNIKPGLFRNEILGVADPLYTLLFEGLWLLADREGRLEDRPIRIKADIFPYRNVDIDAQLNWLWEQGFIYRYEVDGCNYIEINNFSKHQNPHCKEPASSIPAPISYCSSTVNERLFNGNETADSGYRIPDSPVNNQDAGKPARFDPANMDIPANLPREKWVDWIEYRKARKLKTVEQTWKKQLTMLGRASNPGAMIDNSIANGWQGLFEERQNARAGPLSAAEDRQRASELLTGRNRGNGERTIDGTATIVS